MMTSAAKKFMPKAHGIRTDTALSGKFGVRAFNGKRTAFSANTNAAITSNTDAQAGTTEGTDSFDLLAPTSLSWEDIVRSKLESGVAGEAIDLLISKMDKLLIETEGRGLDKILTKMAVFVHEFSNHGFNELALELGSIIQDISHDCDLNLSLDIDDLMADGPSPSDLARICEALESKRLQKEQMDLIPAHLILPPTPSYMAA